MSSASEDENEAENEKEAEQERDAESEVTDEDSGVWETLREKAQREQEERRANASSKYYYDWGTKYKGQFKVLKQYTKYKSWFKVP